MKKIAVYAAIILPAVVTAIKWKVWDGGLGGLVLALSALLLCTIYSDYESKKEKRNQQGRR